MNVKNIEALNAASHYQAAFQAIAVLAAALADMDGPDKARKMEAEAIFHAASKAAYRQDKMIEKAIG